MRFIKTAVLLLVLALSGCKATEKTAENDSAVISFVDDDGVQINMDKPAERIIPMYSAHTENLYFLGAEDRVIGTYKTGNFPPETAELPKYDYNADPEAVIAANPDLVIIRPFIRDKAPDFVAAIENAGITVVSLYPESFDGFDDYINKLAMVTGTQVTAEQLLADFYSQLDEIKAKTSGVTEKQSIFFESTETNVRTAAFNSMPALAIEYAGGANIAADAQPMSEGGTIAEFGEERVLMNADNIDVYVSQRGSMNGGASKQGISERAGFEVIKALKDDRFFTIDEKLISSPTFRYVVGVREIARYLYPDLMDDISQYQNDEPATRASLAKILFNKLHIPVYVPGSSSYYETEQQGHTFGLFADISWKNADFYTIEAVVERGYIESIEKNGVEYFSPDLNITRDELAQTIFLIGDFSATQEKTDIADIDDSKHQRIVQTLVDNDVFTLENGCFNPKKTVTNNEILNALEFVE